MEIFDQDFETAEEFSEVVSEMKNKYGLDFYDVKHMIINQTIKKGGEK